ncbi:hypothetical protein HDU97_006380 [Phlyctochytrium planicorne]|nr:hypothetical protein HDU97_006380 [Phlyctochytrium planicorne]
MLGGNKVNPSANTGMDAEDDGVDQDVMRKRLEEFKRRKAMEKLKSKLDNKRAADKGNFVVPVPKKDVVPDVIPSIMNDGSNKPTQSTAAPAAAKPPKNPAPVVASTAAAAPKPQPIKAPAPPSFHVHQVSVAGRKPVQDSTFFPPSSNIISTHIPQKTSATTTAGLAADSKPANQGIRRMASGSSLAAAAISKPVVEAAPSKPGAAPKQRQVTKQPSRSNLPTSNNNATTSGNQGMAGAKAQQNRIGVGLNRTTNVTTRSAANAANNAASIAASASNDAFYINADTLQGVMTRPKSTSNLKETVAAQSGKVDKKKSKAPASESAAATAAANMVVVKVETESREVQTTQSMAEEFNLTARLVELFEEADRRLESESEKRVAAQCLRMFLTMLKAANSPLGASTSKSSPASRALASPLANKATVKSAERNLSSWDDDIRSPSSPIGIRSNAGAMATAGRTPVLRPGAYKSSDQAKYTPHDDDDDDYEPAEVPMEDVHVQVAAAPKSAPRTSSQDVNSARKDFQVTAPGVRPRVGHLEDDSEIFEPPKSKFLQDMEEEEERRRLMMQESAKKTAYLSPFVQRRSPPAHMRFEAQMPSGDGDDEDEQEVRVRFGDDMDEEEDGFGGAEEVGSVGASSAPGTGPRNGRQYDLWAKHRRQGAGHTPRPSRTFDEDEDDEEEEEDEKKEKEQQDYDDEKENEEEDEEDVDGQFVPFPPRNRATTKGNTPHPSKASNIRLHGRRPQDEESMSTIVSLLNGIQISDGTRDGSPAPGSPRPGTARGTVEKKAARVVTRKDGHTEIRVGPDDVEAGSVTVLTPRRANKKEREELGVDSVVTNARRSMRLFQKDVMDLDVGSPAASGAAEETAVGSVKKVVPYHHGRMGNLEPAEVLKVNELLDLHGAYVPNEKLLQLETTPLVKSEPMLTPRPTHLPSAVASPARTVRPSANARTPAAASSAAPLTGQVLTPSVGKQNAIAVVGTPIGTPLTRAKLAAMKAQQGAESPAEFYDAEDTPRAYR